jgi:hypothetical protein
MTSSVWGGGAADGTHIVDEAEDCSLIGDEWFVKTVLLPGVRNSDALFTMPNLPGITDETEKEMEPSLPKYADDAEYLDSDERSCATAIGDARGSIKGRDHRFNGARIRHH